MDTRQSESRVYMLRVCAEHKLKLGYGDQGERLCPAGCVSPRAEHVAVVPIHDVVKLVREAGPIGACRAADLIEREFGGDRA